MRRPPPGRYAHVATAGEAFKAFVPTALPPDPPIDWSAGLRHRYEDALLATGRLDALSAHLPNAALLLYSFIRKEAVLSSQIEGTQSSLADLLMYEIDEQPGAPVEDATEVSHCVRALEHGLAQLRKGMPLSLRLLRGMHAELMSHPGGRNKTPGEFRRSQVWVGGTRPGNAVFVPPPASDLPECLGMLERFMNDDPETTPPLLKAALAHVQFETIHPFLDGNGRLGRLLIVLQLIADGVLKQPMLYPSLYFKRHRSTYYDLLTEVRIHGDWERWLDFFADAVRVSATQAVNTANSLLGIVTRDRERIASLGRAATSALALHLGLQRQPIATTGALVAATGLTAATVNKGLAHLERLGIVTEVTHRQRGRVFAYSRYIDELAAELEQ